MKKDFEIEYEVLQPMMIGFSRSNSIIGRLIRFIRRVKEPNSPNHVFFITQDRGQFFATEETPKGLTENSLELYTSKNDYITHLFAWLNPYDEDWINEALDELAEIRRKKLEQSQYDFKGLLSFLPIIGKYFKPDDKKQWCSENVATILKKYGFDAINKTEIAPDELLKILQYSEQCLPIYNFYRS